MTTSSCNGRGGWGRPCTCGAHALGVLQSERLWSLVVRAVVIVSLGDDVLGSDRGSTLHMRIASSTTIHYKISDNLIFEWAESLAGFLRYSPVS
jgi:hypothetical protein